MKKLMAILGLCLITKIGYAGLITHTDYTSGATITASGQNTNENAIVSEFNGNIESVNIKDATITGADVAAGTIDYSNLTTTVQSTFTAFGSLTQYRRPVLQFVDSNHIQVDNNTNTTSQTCVFFQSTQRCITDDNSRLVYSSNTASLVTPYKSGLYTGLTEGTTTTWWAWYAVKATDSSSQFVIVGSSMTPKDTSGVSKLNSIFGTNGWVYLGLMQITADSDFKRFVQMGKYTVITSGAILSSSGLIPNGLLYQTKSTSGQNMVVNYSAGMSGLGTLPNTVGVIEFCGMRGTASGSSIFSINDAGDNYTAGQSSVVGTDRIMICLPMIPSVGIKTQNSAAQTSTFDVTIVGWWDNALSDIGGQM